VGIFLLVILAWILLQGNQRPPTAPAEGDSFNGPPPTSQPAGGVLRVAELNIAGGVGGADNKLDLDRTADAIRGFDLVGLEEIHGGGFLQSEDQAQILGEKLKLPWLFAPVERRWWRDAFGNGAITSLPILHWQRFPLSGDSATSNRNFILLRAQYQGQPLNVLITHLSRDSDRPHELKTVISLFESLQEPAILMGDLNSVPTDPQMLELHKAPGVADAIGDEMGDKIGGNIDWIFTRGLRVVRAGTSDNGASDHYLAWAELRLPGNP
jgi:endonuclease/exonuclease/phosphatase family metal-dependent hydrolase